MKEFESHSWRASCLRGHPPSDIQCSVLNSHNRGDVSPRITVIDLGNWYCRFVKLIVRRCSAT